MTELTRQQMVEPMKTAEEWDAELLRLIATTDFHDAIDFISAIQQDAIRAALTERQDGLWSGRLYGLKEALNCVCEIHKDFAKNQAAWDAISQARKVINKKRIEVKQAAIAAAQKEGAENNQLKPCECGGAGEILSNGIGDYFVRCGSCGVETDQQRCEEPNHAIERWNRLSGAAAQKQEG